ncbi:unnamed protein product [Orchesella dallaii]|uniref:Uncharacterized protein n=1 Tax=Orchesella dallaii TaxID=48710 RepID=A0ABP1PXH5_9HEXA
MEPEMSVTDKEKSRKEFSKPLSHYKQFILSQIRGDSFKQTYHKGPNYIQASSEQRKIVVQLEKLIDNAKTHRVQAVVLGPTGSDEIAMIGCRMLNMISKRLSVLRQSNEPFGNLNVFYETEPVADVCLLRKPEEISPFDSESRSGSSMTVTLDKNSDDISSSEVESLSDDCECGPLTEKDSGCENSDSRLYEKLHTSYYGFLIAVVVLLAAILVTCLGLFGWLIIENNERGVIQGRIWRRRRRSGGAAQHQGAVTPARAGSPVPQEKDPPQMSLCALIFPFHH